MQKNIIDRLENTRDNLRTWGKERLDQLQEQRDALRSRGEEALDQGVVAVRNVEATALETTAELLGRGADALGERGELLHKGEAKLVERVVAVRAAHADTLPVADFDALTIKNVEPLLTGMSATDLRVLRAYEVDHKNRVTLLRLIDGLLEELDSATDHAGNATEQAS